MVSWQADNNAAEIFWNSLPMIQKPPIHLVKQFVSLCDFRDSPKHVRVLPLCKGGTRTSAKNFGPISIIPAWTRIIELALYNWTSMYVESIKVIFEKQFFFKHIMLLMMLWWKFQKKSRVIRIWFVVTSFWTQKRLLIP